MVELTPFQTYNLLVGLVVGAELVYFLYLESAAAGYRRFLLVTVFGLVLFVVAGPVVEVVVPSLVHWVHGSGRSASSSASTTRSTTTCAPRSGPASCCTNRRRSDSRRTG